MNLEERIIKLEKSNKRLKIGMSVFGTLFLGILLMGAKIGSFSDEIVAKKIVASEIAANRIRLVEEGNANTVIDAKGMGIFNKNKKFIIAVRNFDDKGIVSIRNVKGEPYLSLGLNEHGGVILLQNKTGETAVKVSSDKHGNGFVGAFNKKGKGRILQPVIE